MAADGGAFTGGAASAGAAGGTSPRRRASNSAISPATNSSVSRHAVPLPMAMTDAWCLRISSSSLCRASAARFCGWCGWMTACSSRLPVSSSTASLQPVR